MMVRRLARPMLATWFVAEGMDVLRHPQPHADAAAAGLERLAARSEGFTPPEPERLRMLVTAHGAGMAAAGAMLATGRAPRFAGLLLATLTLPLAAVDHPFERGLPADERRRRRTRFVQVLAMTGGALLAAADTQGRPGLGWRVDHARQAAGDQARATTRRVVDAVR